jgi:adenylate kinase family enzyme
MKIAVIGISGTGKSTISRKIADSTKLPLYHMDTIIWKENWVEADSSSIEKSLETISKTNAWVIEGWIDHYSKGFLESADTIIYLDYPGWLAMWGGLMRWWRYRGKIRPELPRGCHDSLNFKYLKVMFQRKERPHIEILLADWKLVNVVRCRSRQETEHALSRLAGMDNKPINENCARVE